MMFHKFEVLGVKFNLWDEIPSYLSQILHSA